MWTSASSTPCSRDFPEGLGGYWSPKEEQIQEVERQVDALVTGELSDRGENEPHLNYRRQYAGFERAGKQVIYVKDEDGLFTADPRQDPSMTPHHLLVLSAGTQREDARRGAASRGVAMAMAIPKRTTKKWELIPESISAASAIPERSAAILMMLATSSNSTMAASPSSDRRMASD